MRRHYNDGLSNGNLNSPPDNVFVVYHYHYRGISHLNNNKVYHFGWFVGTVPCKATDLLLAGSQFLELRIGVEVVNGRQADSQSQRALRDLVSDTCIITIRDNR